MRTEAVDSRPAGRGEVRGESRRGHGLDEEALQASRSSIQLHSKSFALASRLLPRRVRERAVVVYAWCRRADDAVDLTESRQGRAALESLRRELDDIYAGRPLTDPILGAFQHVTQECRIPRLYPEELLAGLEMDLEACAYDAMPRLLLYSYRVAGTVGLMMCHVMGLRREEVTRNAVHLGIAMQLTNICRDVNEDWHRGRLYLPAELLQRHGCSGLGARLGRDFPTEARWPVARAIAALLDLADIYYRSGDAGIPALSWRCGIAVRTASKVYAAIGERIRACGCDPARGRAWVSQGAKLQLALRAAIAMHPAWGGRGRDEPLRPPRLVVRAEDVLPVQDLTWRRTLGGEAHA